MSKKFSSKETKDKVKKEIEKLKEGGYLPISHLDALSYAAKGFPVISGISGAIAENFIMGSYIKSWVIDLHKYSSKQKPPLILEDHPEIYDKENIEQIELIVDQFSIHAGYIFIDKLIKTLAKS